MNIEQEIKELRKRLDMLEKQAISKKVVGRFIPSNTEEYYFIDENGDILTSKYEQGFYGDEYRISVGNCFKTKEEAEKYRRILINTQKLKDLAERLNDGKEICWDNYGQYKYYLSIEGDKLCSAYNFKYKSQGIIYCLDKNFLDKAKEEIGEEELIELIKG